MSAIITRCKYGLFSRVTGMGTTMRRRLRRTLVRPERYPEKK